MRLIFRKKKKRELTEVSEGIIPQGRYKYVLHTQTEESERCRWFMFLWVKGLFLLFARKKKPLSTLHTARVTLHLALQTNTLLSISSWLLTGPRAVVIVGDGWDLPFPLPGNVSSCDTMWQKISTAVMAQQCSLPPLHSPPGAYPKPTSNVAHVACGWLILRRMSCSAQVALQINISRFAESTEVLCWLKVWSRRLRTQTLSKPFCFLPSATAHCVKDPPVLMLLKQQICHPCSNCHGDRVKSHTYWCYSAWVYTHYPLPQLPENASHAEWRKDSSFLESFGNMQTFKSSLRSLSRRFPPENCSSPPLPPHSLVCVGFNL